MSHRRNKYLSILIERTNPMGKKDKMITSRYYITSILDENVIEVLGETVDGYIESWERKIDRV